LGGGLFKKKSIAVPTDILDQVHRLRQLAGLPDLRLPVLRYHTLLGDIPIDEAAVVNNEKPAPCQNLCRVIS
jgi:hypothetical protein